MRGILDTSIFIAREQARPIETLPDESAISVITLAELHIGVLVAEDTGVRARRLQTLSEVERTFDPLPVDSDVARAFARLAAEARRAGRRPKVMDTFIAATGLAHGLPVYTQDEDFTEFAEVRIVQV